MDFSTISFDKYLWIFTFPAIITTQTMATTTFLFIVAFAVISIVSRALSKPSSGGVAWINGRNQLGRVSIPGPTGLPIFGSLFSLSRGLAHRTLARTAEMLKAKQLMAFSLGSTPAVVTSDHHIARQILTSSFFSDRPIKQSANLLMFGRAIGFAPSGSYWRLLRKISSAHLFSPKRIAAHESGRQLDCHQMLQSISNQQRRNRFVILRDHLQAASINNITGIVFGKRYKDDIEGRELNDIVREGFELLGAFNWSDYLTWLSCFYDPFRVQESCSKLVPRVKKLVKDIIKEHRTRRLEKVEEGCNYVPYDYDFVDVLLSLRGDERLEEDDMVAVLWEMIFRGTDTTALLTEWIMAELVLNPSVQEKLHDELIATLGPAGNPITDADVAKSPYLQAVVKETLRLHPPGPLLSWARLSTSDVQLSNGMVVPAHTTAMVNMWAITHDPHVWQDPDVFNPERFMGGNDVDVRGGDTRLAPFGAGRRVCPGKNLGLVTVGMWVAKLVLGFRWVEVGDRPVDLSEVLKLSCEMKNPLNAVAVPRDHGISF